VNLEAPFLASDLDELDERLLARADRVVPMRDIHMGDTGPGVIGLRHDIDDNPGSFTTALRLAEWEFEHGYSSTFFLLHGAHYWDDEMLVQAPVFEELGHEVGIHVNAIAEGLRRRRNPHEVLFAAVEELRSCGVRVEGCVAHGDHLCHRAHFVNDELFSESPRPDMGAPDRTVQHHGVAYTLEPVSRAVYGLAYDANWLPRGMYLSDSGGQWSQPFDDVTAGFGHGQLHVLTHPDWWGAAFARKEVTV
jgi:hypothetical protein